MRRRADLKDWVRKLMDENPKVTFGPSVSVVFRCARTGKCRPDLIRLDWWEDDDFRRGYELLLAEEGLILESEQLNWVKRACRCIGRQGL